MGLTGASCRGVDVQGCAVYGGRIAGGDTCCDTCKTHKTKRKQLRIHIRECVYVCVWECVSVCEWQSCRDRWREGGGGLGVNSSQVIHRCLKDFSYNLFAAAARVRLKSNVAAAVAASVDVAADARCLRFISFYGFPCAEE